MNAEEFLDFTEHEKTSSLGVRPRAVLADGRKVSIQASPHHAAFRGGDGRWSRVEVCFPEDLLPPSFQPLDTDRNDGAVVATGPLADLLLDIVDLELVE